MSYRAWPAALLTGTALAAACVVVGEHVVETSDRCLDSAGWFTATPAAWPGDSVGSAQGAALGRPEPASANPAGSGAAARIDDEMRTGPPPATMDPVGQSGDGRSSYGQDGRQISGCLDVDRIEVPGPAPEPDGRA